MPVSKQRSTQLSQARAAHQENLKKRRLDQEIVEDNHDTSEDKANSGWYWHDSSNEDYSDLEEESDGEIPGEEEEEELTELNSQFSIVKPAVLGWDTEGKARLRGILGKWLCSMEERKQQNACEF